mgnify:CR=1 FL=1
MRRLMQIAMIAISLGGCGHIRACETYIDAVMVGDRNCVLQLIAQNRPLEEANHKGETALILAAITDQFRIAEDLLAAGADPFAVSQFGWTAGYAAQTSALMRGPEFDAKARFEFMLSERGYPVPGPDKADIKRLVADGKWPPAD